MCILSRSVYLAREEFSSGQILSCFFLFILKAHIVKLWNSGLFCAACKQPSNRICQKGCMAALDLFVFLCFSLSVHSSFSRNQTPGHFLLSRPLLLWLQPAREGQGIFFFHLWDVVRVTHTGLVDSHKPHTLFVCSRICSAIQFGLDCSSQIAISGLVGHSLLA